MKTSILILSLLLTMNVSAQQNTYLVTGTYTSGKSEGIYVFRVNTATGEATQVHIAKGIKNPSFLAVSPDQEFIYSVEELNGGGNAGKIVAYRFSKKDESLTRIIEKPSGGDDPCYITTDKSGRWVITGNYSSGTVTVHPVDKNGVLGESVSRIQHEGNSINKERQNSPHVHSTVLDADNNFLYVPDLGLDKVMIYAFNRKTGRLTPASTPFAAVNPGSGPRHFEFSQNGRYAYLVEELTGTVTVFSVDKKSGALATVQSISGARPGFSGFMGSADIHLSPDGKFLYISNRGDANDLSIFSINATNGKLTYLTSEPVKGKAPRNFTITPSGSLILVANQGSDEIVIFTRDKNTGKITDSGKRISVPNPVCLKWITP
jgi:6-phosphogluconolactonase